MTRFVLVSDTHNHYPELPAGDILLHAGDFTMGGSRAEIDAAMQWLGDQATKFRSVVCTGGNHDWFFYHLSKELGTQAVRDFIRLYGSENILYLENELGSVALNDGEHVMIYGSPVQPNYGGWAWNQARGAEIKATWDRIPSFGVDILLTHGPAHGILDWWGKERIGCEDLRQAIDRVQPKLHVFGHVHAAYGRGRAFTEGQPTTECYNAAYCGAPTEDGKNYLVDPKHKPWVLDYDGKKFVEVDPDAIPRP